MKAKLVSAAAVIVLTLTTGLVSCSKNELTDSSNLTQAVKITKPEKRKFSRSFDTASVAMAVKSAYINPKVAATIKSFNVKEGDFVNAGSTLAQLDGSDYEIAVNASKAQLSAAEAGVMQAEAAFAKISADYERFKTLKQNGSVSDSEFEQVESGYKQAEAGLAAAKAQKNMAQSALDGNTRQFNYTSIIAPFSGYIASRNGEIGEMASPANPRPMFEIVQTDKLKIEIFISELEIGGIDKNTTAKVIFDAFPEKEVTARVNLINSKVDTMTKSIKVEMLIDNPGNVFKSGMTVRVRFTLPEHEYLVVPRNAVFTRDNEAGIIYAKNEADRVFTKEVFIGGSVEGYSIIEKGLDGSEDVVVGGGRRLEEGQKVNVISDNATAESEVKK
ncbi:MAG TPA: efflux RND transporter periplasmic adaptor subunit [bacterium]|nr:efflux RND transporter periplasmic adaptor subunit [bacterium]HRQ69209.1 efflux RND transporter periplasmic adaptor subunit [bacterium]